MKPTTFPTAVATAVPNPAQELLAQAPLALAPSLCGPSRCRDAAKARSEANSLAIEQLLRQDIADMKALKVDRTTGFFVNGTPLRDFGEAQLEALVDQETQRANVR